MGAVLQLQARIRLRGGVTLRLEANVDIQGSPDFNQLMESRNGIDGRKIHRTTTRATRTKGYLVIRHPEGSVRYGAAEDPPAALAGVQTG